MGCSSNTKVVEFKETEDYIGTERKLIEELEANNSVPTEEQKMLIVRYNINIYEQIDSLTKALKIKSTKEKKRQLDLLVQTFNDLIQRWKNISKEEEEEVQLMMRNEE